MNLDFGVVIADIERDFPGAMWLVRKNGVNYFANIIIESGRPLQVVVVAQNGGMYPLTKKNELTYPSHGASPGLALFNSYMKALRERKQHGHSIPELEVKPQHEPEVRSALERRARDSESSG